MRRSPILVALAGATCMVIMVTTVVAACVLAGLALPLGVLLLPTATPETPVSTPTATRIAAVVASADDLTKNLAQILSTDRPPRDPFDLAQRLKGVRVPTPGPTMTPVVRSPGDQDIFWVSDQEKNEHFVVTATLRYVTDHAYFYVDNSVTYDQAKLKDSADAFELKIVPTNLRVFGDLWAAGPDGDSHITVLNTLTPGAGGYYSSADEYPREVNRYSNLRRMIYIDVKSYPIGGARYGGVLAHELQHAMHWLADPEEDGWVNEGLSELAVRLNGFQTTSQQNFARQPDTQLDTWSDQPNGNGAHYGASYLFASYFFQRFGQEAVAALVANRLRGIEGFNAVLAARGTGLRFEDVFQDWVVANLAHDETSAGMVYGYKDVPLTITPGKRVAAFPFNLDLKVPQFGTQYIDLGSPNADVNVRFTGNTVVGLLGPSPHSGRYLWWGNRGDSMDTSLTRELDLTGLQAATLSYWVWYNIEEDWDYAYVLVSTDQGATWQPLPAGKTTDRDPIGHNYGHGYTGRSDEWVQDSVNLADYAGKRILVRFEYVTDDAVNNPGFAVDDVCLVEVRQCDDAEVPGSWQPKGFVRAEGWLPQSYAIQIIRTGSATRVERISLDAANRVSFTVPGVGSSRDRVTLAISGLTPVTTEPGVFELSMTNR